MNNAHGILVDGAVYECSFFNPHLEADPSCIAKSCLYVDGTSGGGNGGSIDIYGGTMVNGLHNIFADSGGVKVFGGTYLTAYNEGIYLANNLEGGVYGSHVENAWQGGVASPGWSTAQAGIFIAGAG